MSRSHNQPIDKVHLFPYSADRFGLFTFKSVYGSLAQLVEQHTFNVRVDGSSPSRPTRLLPWK